MNLAQMPYQSIVGISARLSQVFHFFPHALKVISEQSSTISLRIRIEPDRALVGSEQVMARFTHHSILILLPLGKAAQTQSCNCGI